MRTPALLSFLILLTAAAPAVEPVAPLPELRCDLRDAWRLGAPAFASEEFPQPLRPEPVLYLSHMKPRGVFVLRDPGVLATTPESQQRVLRSPQVDVTGLLNLVGAQFQADNGAAQWFDAPQLPKLKVRYDPEMTSRVVVPSQPGTCVLLLEIGEGHPNEWTPGLWTVKLRFDGAPLNVRLAPFALTGTPDPARPAGSALIFDLKFRAQPIRSEDDQLNLDLFHYADARATNGTAHALAALDRILAAYPNDGNLRYARAELLKQAGRNQEALEDLRTVESLAVGGQLRRRFLPPGQERMTRQEALEWLRSQITTWAGRQ
jgi:tetratricopeptide (TPR) repeat protein